MENNEIKELIASFKEYRDLISPIEQNLRAFSMSFENIRQDIQNLNSDFDGSLQIKLDKIYKELASQADKAKTLSLQVDKFSNATSRYISGVDGLVDICGRIEEKLVAVDTLQIKAEAQIERLELIMEEKRKTYNIKQLEKSLENYNIGVKQVSEYINKDIADVLKTSNEMICEIQDKNKSIFESVVEEKGSVDKLVESFDASNKLLKKIVENNDVNEQYIFEILDRWAEDRKLKIKK